MQVVWRQATPGVYDGLVRSSDDGVEHLVAQLGQEDQTYAFVARELVYLNNATDTQTLNAAQQAISEALIRLAVTMWETFPEGRSLDRQTPLEMGESHQVS